jgi:hypothetical protein
LSERQLPEQIRELYESRWREAAELHSVWIMLQQLFDGSTSNARIFRHTGIAFFMMVRKAMRDSIILSVARLTDPPTTGGRQNASLPALLDKIRDCDAPTLVERLDALMTEIHELATPIRARRNRELAHADLETTLMKRDPVPGVGFSLLDELSKKIAEFLNAIDLHFTKSETRFDNPMMLGDAKTLLSYLGRALDVEDADRAQVGISPLK